MGGEEGKGARSDCIRRLRRGSCGYSSVNALVSIAKFPTLGRRLCMTDLGRGGLLVDSVR